MTILIGHLMNWKATEMPCFLLFYKSINVLYINTHPIYKKTIPEEVLRSLQAYPVYCNKLHLVGRLSHFKCYLKTFYFNNI